RPPRAGRLPRRGHSWLWLSVLGKVSDLVQYPPHHDKLPLGSHLLAAQAVGEVTVARVGEACAAGGDEGIGRFVGEPQRGREVILFLLEPEGADPRCIRPQKQKLDKQRPHWELTFVAQTGPVRPAA